MRNFRSVRDVIGIRHHTTFRKAGIAVAALAAVTGLAGGTAQASAQQGAEREGGVKMLDAVKSRGGHTTHLRILMNRRADGSAPQLNASQRRQLNALGTDRLQGRGPGKAAKAPGTLRCGQNPSWSDANGTLHMRFNCKYGTINWGYKLSARLQAIITSNVTERGASWWKNGKHMPRNSGHVKGKSYLFHGTFKPVGHGDHIQSQDYFTFRVNIGGQTGTGSLTWTSDVRATK
jgi:hypothetical protein